MVLGMSGADLHITLATSSLYILTCASNDNASERPVLYMVWQ